MPTPTSQCAHALIEVLPDLMQLIRSYVRSQRGPGLTVVQLRTLAFVNRRPGVALSDVADYVGLTLSSMSTQVSKLVTRGLLARAESEQDRRYVTLTVTTEGLRVLSTARAGAEVQLAERLASLDDDACGIVIQAMELLRGVATPPSSASSLTLE